MVASVAVGVWIGRSLLPGSPARRAMTCSAVPGNVAAAPDAPTALDAAYVSDPRYQRERAALLQTLQARLAALPPPAAPRSWRVSRRFAGQAGSGGARSARTRAMRCCRSSWSTLTRMRCASSRTCTKPATLAGGSEHAVPPLSGSWLVLVASAAVCASTDKSFERQVPAQARGVVDISNVSGTIQVSRLGSARSQRTRRARRGRRACRRRLAITAARSSKSCCRSTRRARRRRDLHVQVPKDSELDVSAVSADVVTNGVRGVQRLMR